MILWSPNALHIFDKDYWEMRPVTTLRLNRVSDAFQLQFKKNPNSLLIKIY
jgi:hypothetical protein